MYVYTLHWSPSAEVVFLYYADPPLNYLESWYFSQEGLLCPPEPLEQVPFNLWYKYLSIPGTTTL